jgi:hypothetical protein
MTEAPPFGETVLYLRGTMNNWAALEEYALQFSCDAYYLNTKLKGRYEFRLADAAWTPSLTSEPITLEFDGEQTLRAVIVAERPLVSLGPKSFADPNTQPVDHPVARSLHFDSRSLDHKKPFGAVVQGTEIEFTVSALPGVSKLTLVVDQRRLEGNQEVLEYLPLARVAMERRAFDKLSPSGEVGANRPFDKLRENGNFQAVQTEPVAAQATTASSTHAPLPVRAEPVEAQAATPTTDHWTARHTFTAQAVHGYWFEAEIDGQVFVLQNNAEPIFWTRE